jgi:hypothetical protein
MSAHRTALILVVVVTAVLPTPALASRWSVSPLVENGYVSGVDIDDSSRWAVLTFQDRDPVLSEPLIPLLSVGIAGAPGATEELATVAFGHTLRIFAIDDARLLAVGIDPASASTSTPQLWAAGAQGSNWGTRSSLSLPELPIQGEPIGIAGNDDGDVVVSWVKRGRVLAARYRIRGGWAPPSIVSTRARRTRAISVAINDAGDSAISWVDRPASVNYRVIRAAIARDRRAFSESRVARVSRGPGEALVAVDRSGRTNVLSRCGEQLCWSRRGAGAASWSPLAEVPGATKASPYVFDTDAIGNVTFAWIGPDQRARIRMHRVASGHWSAMNLVGNSSRARRLTIDVAPSGNATLAFVRDGSVWATRRLGGSWYSSKRLGNTSDVGTESELKVAVNDRGATVVGWGYAASNGVAPGYAASVPGLGD